MRSTHLSIMQMLNAFDIVLAASSIDSAAFLPDFLASKSAYTMGWRVAISEAGRMDRTWHPNGLTSKAKSRKSRKREKSKGKVQPVFSEKKRKKELQGWHIQRDDTKWLRRMWNGHNCRMMRETDFASWLCSLKASSGWFFAKCTHIWT